MEKNNTHCFVAGRSGGHIIPALTLARQAREKNPETKILFFSTAKTLDKKIISAAQIDWSIALTLENIPFKKFYLLPFFCWQLMRSFFCAFYHLKKRKPRTVVSTGGYVSIPVCIAAKLLRIPIELFELNVIPGKTTKFLAPLAKKIHICFEKTRSSLAQKKCELTQYPQRFSKNTTLSREKVLKQFGFAPEKRTVLILGGSQGSLFINNLIKSWVQHNEPATSQIQLIHQAGAQDKTGWDVFYKTHNIPAIARDFFQNVQELYLVADLVICRSGAGSLFETLFFKKLCITIPLEIAQNDHQLYNALEMQKLHPDLFTVVRQAEIKKDIQPFLKLMNTKILANKTVLKPSQKSPCIYTQD